MKKILVDQCLQCWHCDDDTYHCRETGEKIINPYQVPADCPLPDDLPESKESGWISIEESQPKPQQRVYVVCENPKHGGGVIRFQTMAEYIPYMTVKEEDYMADEYAGDGDYNEEEDEYYTPEGFYEWQSEPEMNWKISAKVTHWMPLIALP